MNEQVKGRHAYYDSYEGFEPVIMTSKTESGAYWIRTNDGHRAKVDAASLAPITPHNDTILEAWKRLKAEEARIRLERQALVQQREPWVD